jgi:uncharacterized protein YecA (UPF0149 family)
MWRDSGKDHPAAERILRQALERPALEDRQNVLERLIDLYEEWGQPDKQAPLLAELAKLKPKEIWSHAARSKLTSLPQPDTPSAPQVQKPKRNDPCWCGSGKKYKQCHLKTDRP